MVSEDLVTQWKNRTQPIMNSWAQVNLGMLRSVDGMVRLRVKRISLPGSGASLCRSRCCSSGTSCCSAWRGCRRARWGTSQSSRPRRSCWRDSRWSAWGQRSECLGHRWGKAAFPGGTGRGGAHPSRSHPPSQEVETWARIHSQDGHVSETRGFPHSYSSPAKVKENDSVEHNVATREWNI